jgi:hypothetical protein
MATYPSLTPSTRSLSYGDYPQGTYEAVSGANVRFKYGSDRVVQRLQLGYQYLAETEMQLLLDHYEGQQGTLIPFALRLRSGLATPRRLLPLLIMNGAMPVHLRLASPHPCDTTQL